MIPQDKMSSDICLVTEKQEVIIIDNTIDTIKTIIISPYLDLEFNVICNIINKVNKCVC
jgi:hypothetical protein